MLEECKLDYISLKLFEHSSQLKSLKLYSNPNLKKIIPGSLDACPMLQHISIKKNLRLTDIKIGVFNNLKRLRELKLADSNIAVLEQSCFTGCDMLESIDMHECKVTNIKRGIFDGSLQHLTTILLGHNEQLTGIEPGAFSECPSLSELHLQHCGFTHLGKNTFNGMQRLTTLKLNNNKLLSKIGSNCFDHCPSLTDLDLSKCALKKLLPETFIGCSNLSKLVLCDNIELTELQDGCFSGLNELRQLELDNCRLQRLTPGTLAGLTNLDQLALKNNSQLTGLEDGCFNDLSRLTDLLLDNCGLQRLKAETFVGLTNLRRVNISDNTQLTHLEDGCFNDLRQLTDLVIQNCGLQRLTAETFNGLSNLRELSLTYNTQLHHIDPGCFVQCAQLAVVDMFSCRLGVIDLSTFNIGKYFLLRDNNIQLIQTQLQQQLIDGSRLDLSGNNLIYIDPILKEQLRQRGCRFHNNTLNAEYHPLLTPLRDALGYQVTGAPGTLSHYNFFRPGAERLPIDINVMIDFLNGCGEELISKNTVIIFFIIASEILKIDIFTSKKTLEQNIMIFVDTYIDSHTKVFTHQEPIFGPKSAYFGWDSARLPPYFESVFNNHYDNKNFHIVILKLLKKLNSEIYEGTPFSLKISKTVHVVISYIYERDPLFKRLKAHHRRYLKENINALPKEKKEYFNQFLSNKHININSLFNILYGNGNQYYEVPFADPSPLDEWIRRYFYKKEPRKIINSSLNQKIRHRHILEEMVKEMTQNRQNFELPDMSRLVGESLHTIMTNKDSNDIRNVQETLKRNIMKKLLKNNDEPRDKVDLIASFFNGVASKYISNQNKNNKKLLTNFNYSSHGPYNDPN